jgi:F-type H+-transporting ATPase subunit gamma
MPASCRAPEYVIRLGREPADAAENEARIAAMRSAKHNLKDMRSDLQALERQIRQEEITAEVVELSGSVSRRRGN